MFLTMVQMANPAWDTLLDDERGPEWSTAGGWWLPVGARENRLTIHKMSERGDMVYWGDAYDCFEA